MRVSRVFLFVALLALAPAALASKNPVAVAKGDFAAQRAEIEKKLADGKTYVEITPAAREKTLEALGRISTQLEGAASLDALPEPARTAVLKDEKLVNDTLRVAARDSRVVCEREHIIGSNRPVNVCKTVAERARRE